VWNQNFPSFERTQAIFAMTAPTTPLPLIDPQGRVLDYLRLSVTDRCNLRCRYCMPAEGVPLVARDMVLSMEELQRVGAIFTQLGVRKIRITGGEPLLRKGVVDLLGSLHSLPQAPDILLTTNGILLRDNIDALYSAGLRRINLSLDTLDAKNWVTITRRSGHETVMHAIDLVLAKGMGLKVNVVVMPGVNDHELNDFVALTRDRDISVRFIEPMPFDGAGKPLAQTVTGDEIRARIGEAYQLEPIANTPGAVDKLYKIEGHQGDIGIIEGHSRTFCSSCRRVRVDARGRLRTCLYGRPQTDLRVMMRDGASDAEIMSTIRDVVAKRLVDGKAAEQDSRLIGLESMVAIGG
jgi:molybdenum cofactor biosynthesis protein A